MMKSTTTTTPVTSSLMTIMTMKPTKISVEAFAKEISDDLPELVKTYGVIFYTNLAEYYGESINRIKSAIDILWNKNIVSVVRSSNNAFIIIPVSNEKMRLATHPDLIVLTPLQRSVVIKLVQACKKQNASLIQTNYSQLARVSNCSYGGLRACLQRLEELEYVAITAKGLRGKQDVMLIELTMKTRRLMNVE